MLSVFTVQVVVEVLSDERWDVGCTLWPYIGDEGTASLGRFAAPLSPLASGPFGGETDRCPFSPALKDLEQQQQAFHGAGPRQHRLHAAVAVRAVHPLHAGELASHEPESLQDALCCFCISCQVWLHLCPSRFSKCGLIVKFPYMCDFFKKLKTIYPIVY